MSKDIITFEIDTACIKLMKTRGNTIEKWATFSLKSDIASNPKTLGAAIKKIKKDSGIRGGKVIASASGIYSVSRILLLSHLNTRLTTEQAIQEAVIELTGMSQDKMYYSWQTITSGDDGTRILIVCVPRENIDIVFQALKAADMKPYLMEYKPLALARTINKKQALILNIESYGFDVILVANGIPEIMRTIPWQYDSLTSENKVEHLISNLKLTVDFYNSYCGEGILPTETPLFIMGEMSNNPKLIEHLKTKVTYFIESWTPPLQCPPQLPMSDYAVNIGLALKGMRKSIHLLQDNPILPDINLLPKTYRPWKLSMAMIYFICLIMAAFSLLAFLYNISSSSIAKTAELEAKYTFLGNQLKERQVETKKSALWMNVIKEYNIILKKDGNFTEEIKFIYTEADRMGIQIQSTIHDGKSINITYQADNYISFRNYLTSLQNSGRFSQIAHPLEQYPYIKGGTIKIIPR